MSNNPRTQTWRRRAERLANWFCYTEGSLDDALVTADASAPDYLVTAAIRIAEEKCVDLAGIHTDQADMYRRKSLEMRKLVKQRTAPPALRIVRSEQS